MGWSYSIEASVISVQEDGLQDLLRQDAAAHKPSKPAEKLMIQHDPETGTPSDIGPMRCLSL